MEIRDYSEYLPHRITYGGSEEKISIKTEDGIYMMKARTKAPASKHNLVGSYYNNVLSEYIGSHIYELLGIPVQETYLGRYHGELVVLCKDFTDGGERLQEFQNYKVGFISSNSSGRNAELKEIMDTIKENMAIPEELKIQVMERFWDMFIVDALIGNPDRHNGNWGLIYNKDTDCVRLAPVYDCGASLFARLDDNIKKDILDSKTELNLRIYNRPHSAITIDGKKLHYNEFIGQGNCKECSEALKRIVPRVNLQSIGTLIDDISVLSELNKAFYKTIIVGRYEKVLEPAYRNILKQEAEKSAVTQNIGISSKRRRPIENDIQR